MCAVMVPRLLGALTAKNHGELLFFSPEYFEAAVIVSVLVGLVVAILEWGVPRSPSDTFMTTLGIPAILAGALSANQDAAAFQQQQQTREALAAELSEETGIVIEPTTSDRPDDGNGPQSLINFFVPTVYAEEKMPPLSSSSGSTQLAIRIREPRYLVVLDRASTQQQAETKISQWTHRLTETAPANPLALAVQQQGSEFFVVIAGGPRAKADALLEALRVKNTYQVVPTLVEAGTTP